MNSKRSTCSDSECDRVARARGMCLRHYNYQHRHGLLPRRPSNAEEYESRIDRSGGPDACHPWTRCTTVGYGQFQRDGENLATRWGYKHYIGPLSAAEMVRHTCDNPPCQNRRHWLKGSARENSRDMVSRGRSSFGVKNQNAVLDDAAVAVIRAEYIPGKRGQAREMAAKYGVDRRHIWRVANNRRWVS